MIKWTKEKITEVANTFNNKLDFMNDRNDCYKAAWRRGIIKEVCSHMDGNVRWTDDMLRDEALKYDNKRDFKKGAPIALMISLRRGIMDDICGHMNRLNIKWTDDMISEEALKYNSRTEFSEGSPNAYSCAKVRKILPEISKHMISAKGGYDNEKSGYFYFAKIKGTGLFKIGITNRGFIKRYSKWELDKMEIVSEIFFEDGMDAKNLETKVKSEFKSFRYNGEKILNSGHTEIYSVDMSSFIKENIKS